MYSSLLPLASFPALAYAARREIPFCWRYSIMLVLTQLALTPVGVAFLLSRSPSEVAAAAAAVFVPFCMVKLVQSSLDFGMSRIGGGGGGEQMQAAAAGAEANCKIVRDATDTVILGALQPHTPCMLRLLERHRLKSKFEAAFPFISEAGRSSECVIAVMLLAGAASGFIGSVVGTSSPPQLFAFTYLDLTKGAATPSAPARAH